VSSAAGDATVPGFALIPEESVHVLETARGQDVDDLVVLDVSDRRGVAHVVLAQLQSRLVVPDGARAVETRTVLPEQCFVVGGDDVVDVVPVTVALPGHLLDSPGRPGPSPNWLRVVSEQFLAAIRWSRWTQLRIVRPRVDSAVGVSSK